MPKPNQTQPAKASVDELCARFVDQWTAGSTGTIESILGLAGAREVDQYKLILRLIQHDIELRRQSGEIPDPSDYLQRFPNVESDRLNELFLLPAPPPPDISSPVLPARYRVMEEIGRGGIGSVWRVHDQELDRPLAVKVLHHRHRQNAAANARLDREALLTGSLQHPGIPPIHERGKLVYGSSFFLNETGGRRYLGLFVAEKKSRRR